jgi:hypothetical protein
MMQSSATLEIEVPKVYSMPAAAPMFGPQPYKYQGCRQATIFFKTAPRRSAG